MVKIRTGAKPSAPKATPGIIFNAEAHTYRMNTSTNGEVYRAVNGVTTVIGKTLAKPALTDWKVGSVARAVREDMSTTLMLYEDFKAGRISDKKFDAEIVKLSEKPRDRAASRGTRIHDMAEKVVSGEPVQVPADIAAPVDQYARWLETYDFHPTHTERPCGNRTHWYAGTFDLRGTFGRGPFAGETWMLDLKSSNNVYGETSLQTIAYEKAEFYIDENGVDHPMPPSEGIGVVHLQPQFAKLHPLGSMDDAWEEFQAILTLHKSRSRRDNLIERKKP